VIPAFLPDLLQSLLDHNLLYLGLWSGADFAPNNFMADLQPQMIDKF